MPKKNNNKTKKIQKHKKSIKSNISKGKYKKLLKSKKLSKKNKKLLNN